MLVDMISMHMMQVSVVQVVEMPIVFDCRVAAAWFVLMVMLRMLVAGTHFVLLQRTPKASG